MVLKYEFSKDNIHIHAKVDGESPRDLRPQPYVKNCGQLRNAESQRHALPQGRAHHLVIPYQKLSPGNMNLKEA